MAEASKNLQVLTNGALNSEKALKKVQDVAAATGAPVDTMATAVADLYNALKSGDGVEAASGQLKNGKSLGEKPVDPFEMAHWDVVYAPGELLAVGKKNGREVSRKRIETTGDPVALELVPDRGTIAGDGEDAMPVTVRAIDAKGREVPTAMNPVKFSLRFW